MSAENIKVDFENLSKVLDIINDIMEKTKGFSSLAFESMWCMVLEEYCKARELDILEVVNSLHNGVIEVNKELGKY